MGPDDLLVAITYPRYVTDTIVLARGAFERGVRVLALTDSAQSPLVPFAHGCLFAQTENQYATNSESSALALIEALSSAVAHQSRESVKSVARMTETVLPWLHDGSRSRLAPRSGPDSSTPPKGSSRR